MNDFPEIEHDKINTKYTKSERYAFVEMEYKGRPVYAVEFLKIPFCGIMVVYDRVELIPHEDHAVLSFDYEVVRHIPGSWTEEQLEQYAGEILEEILEQQAQKGELVFANGTDENRENAIIELTPQRGLLS